MHWTDYTFFSILILFLQVSVESCFLYNPRERYFSLYIFHPVSKEANTKVLQSYKLYIVIITNVEVSWSMVSIYDICVYTYPSCYRVIKSCFFIFYYLFIVLVYRSLVSWRVFCIFIVIKSCFYSKARKYKVLFLLSCALKHFLVYFEIIGKT